jgi:hypothetical protein
MGENVNLEEIMNSEEMKKLINDTLSTTWNPLYESIRNGDTEKFIKSFFGLSNYSDKMMEKLFYERNAN